MERLPPLFTFLPAVTPTVTYTRRKTQASRFYFFIFTDLLLVPFFFSFGDGSAVKESPLLWIFCERGLLEVRSGGGAIVRGS